MYVNVYRRTCAYICVCMYKLYMPQIYPQTYIFIHIHVYTYTYILHAYTIICTKFTYISINIHTRAYMYTRIFHYMYAIIRVDMNICTCDL